MANPNRENMFIAYSIVVAFLGVWLGTVIGFLTKEKPTPELTVDPRVRILRDQAEEINRILHDNIVNTVVYGQLGPENHFKKMKYAMWLLDQAKRIEEGEDTLEEIPEPLCLPPRKE